MATIRSTNDRWVAPSAVLAAALVPNDKAKCLEVLADLIASKGAWSALAAEQPAFATEIGAVVTAMDAEIATVEAELAS